MNVAIIGAGGWGTALAIQAIKNHNVKMWSQFPDEINRFKQNQENTIYLPGIKLPKEMTFTTSIEEIIDFADIYIFVVPSKYFSNTIKLFEGKIPSDKYIVSASKGLDPSTNKRMSEILENHLLTKHSITVISGPSHAEEVAKGIPTSVVAASKDESVSKYIQNNFSTKDFRIYRSNDVVGVEIGGVIKNIIAIASGIAHGLKLGDNTIAALITRGMAEMRRFGTFFGASFETFSGLSGIGDLIVTCMSKHSRNNRVGYQLGQGKKIEEIIKDMKMVAEGVDNVKIVHEISTKNKIEMPITNSVYNIIYNNVEPTDELKNLFARSLKKEIW